MQRHNVPVQISMLNSPEDIKLLDIKTRLQNSYWASPEGVFVFQFQTDNQPLPLPGPMRFNLIRYTPDLKYQAFILAIPGIVNNDGSFNYGGGREGKIANDVIFWNDGGVWTPIKNIPQVNADPLNLNTIVGQAKIDSVVIGGIYDKYYNW